MRIYKKMHHRETGNQIRYDIQELRRDPQRITRWIKQRETPTEWQKHDNVTTMWGKIKKNIHQGLIQCYPSIKQGKKLLPTWAQKAQQWSTPEEWDTFQTHLTERRKLQGEITKLDHLSKKQLKNITLNQIMNAWKQAAQYTKKRKQEITYDKSQHPPEKRHRPRAIIREYHDTVKINGETDTNFQQHPIKITSIAHTKTLRTHYRDTLRRRGKNLRSKFQTHGKFAPYKINGTTKN